MKRVSLLLAAAIWETAAARPASVPASASSRQPASESAGVEVGLWRPVTDQDRAPSLRPDTAPRKYLSLFLDHRKLGPLLARVPLEGSDEARTRKVVMELPWPDGSFGKFRIVESPIMEPELAAAAFPELATYRGQGIDDRTATLFFDWTPEGLHAMLVSSRGTVYVDPIAPVGDLQHHVVYFQSDQTAPSQVCTCEMTGKERPQRVGRRVPSSSAQAVPGAILEVSFYWARLPIGDCSYRLIFRRDGAALRKILRSHGALDRICRGAVSQEQFAGLATVVQGQAFFDLEDLYRHEELADGYAARTTVVSGRQRKTVINSNWAGPDNLETIEDAINALGQRIVWTEIWPLRP